MKALIQRVNSAKVEVNEQRVGSIDRGLLILLGVDRDDDESLVKTLVDRCMQYRIFPDADGKMNLSCLDLDAQVLVVSQFTLSANTQKGLRPSFTSAASPEIANALYEQFVGRCREQITIVETGVFGADMQVSLVNDGPVTFMLEC